MNSLNIAPITSDAMETGPTPKCLELPRTEYIIGGTKLESAEIRVQISELLSEEVLLWISSD